MKVRQIFPMLSVADLGVSLHLYRDVLGGEPTYYFPDEQAPVFVVLRFGDSDVGLASIGAEPPLHVQPLRPVQGHRVEFCVYVDDLDAAVMQLRAENAPILVEPVTMPWGERIAYAADPDGNLLMLTQATAEQA